MKTSSIDKRLNRYGLNQSEEFKFKFSLSQFFQIKNFEREKPNFFFAEKAFFG